MNKALLWQLMRFGFIGVSASFVHFCTVVFLVQCFAFAPLYANVFGFILGFQVSYFGNYLWTFKQIKAPHRKALPKLLLLQLVNFALNESLFSLLLSFNLPYRLALLIVIMILPPFTFIVCKVWIFAAPQVD
jgi:putative flippase GtrA